MKESKEFICIRYLVLIAIALQMIIGYKDESIISVIFICLFVINNQIRLFYLEGKLNYVSVAVEFIMALLVYNIYGGNLIIYAVSGIIDCFIILDLYYSKYILG
ncbi:MAG: hypothetical protein ACRC2K_10315, partial [Clostridium sp.]